jgi:uncharacterized RDD family membrane protein YckC
MLQKVGFFRHLAIFFYDSLLIIALLACATFPFIWLFGDATSGLRHYALQIYLWLIAGIYFVASWYRTGQTLSMKTWRVQLRRVDGQAMQLKPLLLRYIAASFSLLFFAAGFFWAWLDREHCALHDRLLGYRLYRLMPQQTPASALTHPAHHQQTSQQKKQGRQRSTKQG